MEAIMACFLVPLTEAVVVSVVKGTIGLKHKTDEHIKSVKEKLGWLQKLEFGGAFLLAIEHIYHGEVVLYPPFLTSMRNPEDTAEMLHEMATVGVGMAVLVTAVWGIMWAVSAIRKNKANKKVNIGGVA